ncbi:hypothetical protein F5884DRAFT_810039 [Xylogone sp. PMI_703]|nr:hypothetical protein F5884DRAFT_810039 [Xylogone sp. PMI_703]
MGPVDGRLTRPSNRNRAHICERCHRAFVRAEHLHRHLLSHDGTKPHCCQYCGTSFGRPDVLKRHLKKCPKYPRDAMGAEQPATYTTRSPITDDSQLRSPNSGMVMRSNLDSHESPPGAGAGNTAPLPGAVAVRTEHDVPDSYVLDENLLPWMPPPRSPTYPRSNMRWPLHQPPSAPIDLHPHEQVNTPQPLSSPQRPMYNKLNESEGVSCHGGTPGQQDVSPTGYANQGAILSQSQLIECNQSLPWDSTPEGSNELADIGNLNFMFLEDAFLQGFGQTTMESRLPEEYSNSSGPNQTPDTARQDILGDKFHHFNALSFRNKNRTITFVPDEAYSRGPSISQDDVDRFKAAAFQDDKLGCLNTFSFPLKSRMMRLLDAYFEYFDAHTPIIHQPTFNILDTPAALVLAMLAIGGIYVSEHDFACSAYEAAYALLSQYELDIISDSRPDIALWHIQAALLCVQFGAFSEKSAYFQQSQKQFSLVTLLLRNLENEKSRLRSEKDWTSWILFEAWNRAACWAVVLNSIILLFDPFVVCVVPHQIPDLSIPGEERLWRAESAQDWLEKGGSALQRGESSIWKAAKSIMAGDPLTAVSSFGLLGLVGSILGYICSYERLVRGFLDLPEDDFIQKIERGLNTWESAWRRNLRNDQRQDPLMTDCLPLLGAAYYHLYLGTELETLKRIAADPNCNLPLPTVRANSNTYKAIKYAVNSWHVRVVLGVVHMQKTAPLKVGGHFNVTSYEAALILSWWLTLPIETRRLVSPYHNDSERNQQSLEAIFVEIFDEIEDQGINCIWDTKPALFPLTFYRTLIKKWIWTCKCDEIFIPV